MITTHTTSRFVLSGMIAIALFSLATYHSVAYAASDKAALRKLAQVPSVDINIDFGFNTTIVRVGLFDPQEVAEEAQRLARELGQTRSFDPKLAPKLLHLADLFHALQQDSAALESYATVANGLQPIVAKLPAKPDSVPLLLNYSRALLGIHREAEAEKSVRLAVKLAPQSPDAWDILGETLNQRATVLMMGAGNTSDKPDKPGKAGDGKSGKPEKQAPVLSNVEKFKQLKNQKEVLARIGALLDEADRAYDRAVQVAPQSPQPYLERGIYRGFSKKVTATLFAAARKGEDPGPSMQATLQGVMQNASAPEMLGDYATASRLAGNSFSLVAWYLTAEVLHYQMEHPQTGPAPEMATPDRMRPEARANFSRELQHLVTLSQSDQRSLQVSASVALATIRFLAGQIPETEQLARHLTEISPDRARPYQLLSAIYAQSRRFDVMASLFQTRIRRRDTVEDRLVLARIYSNMNRWDSVETSVQAALKLQPKNFRALTAQVACLLHKGDEAALKRAKQVLDTNGPRLGKEPVAPNTAIAFMLNQAIYFGLTNHTKEAKGLLQQILSRAPDLPEATAMLKSIE